MFLQNFNIKFTRYENFVDNLETQKTYNILNKIRGGNFHMTTNGEKLVAQKIKDNYIKKEGLTKLEELKALDKKVKKPALIFAYVYGVLGSLILGLGMCLAMKVLGDIMVLGIIIGLVGIAMVATTYPIYQKMLAARKEKYSSEIISKSNELLND